MDRIVAFLAVEHNDARVSGRSPAECARRFAKAKQVLRDRVPGASILSTVDRDFGPEAGLVLGAVGREIVSWPA